MKKLALLLILSLTLIPAQGTDWTRLLQGALKAGTAMSITDEDLADAVKSEVKAMDAKNTVCGESSPYTKRLKRLTKGMTNANGIKLNFKVYKTRDINAFACPDGSVRVFSALMDILDDNELLGVIGHEIGHVALRHSKKAWRSALLRSAASDVIGSRSETWAALSDSYVGAISSVALSAKHSRTHETEADDYGYDFLKKNGLNFYSLQALFWNQLLVPGETSVTDKDLTRDGFHMSYREGRYATACVWFEALIKPTLGVSVKGNSFRNSGENEVSDKEAALMQKTAIKAVKQAK